MNSLPIEILTKISNYLSFSDRKSFSLVCLRFNQSLYFKELWENVTFVIGKAISLKIHIHFLSILTNIKFFSVNIIPQELSEILKHTKNLLNLHLIICPSLFLDPENLTNFFKKNIDFDVKIVLNNLQSLSLSGNKATLTNIGFNCFVENCCSLKKLDLSELEIENLDNIWNWSLEADAFYSENKWAFSKFLGNYSEKSNQLSFSNIISKLIFLAGGLKEINLCSTPIGYDELFILSTMPRLELSVIRLDNCKNINIKAIKAVLDFQCHSLEEISFINTFPITMNWFVGNFFTQNHPLKKIRVRGTGQRETQLFQNIRLSNIQIYFLHLENCSIDDHFIDGLNQIKTIRKLYLLGCNFSKLETNILLMQNLIELNLSRSYGAKLNDFTRSIFSLVKIELLKLDWLKIDDDLIGGILEKGLNGLSSLRHLQTLSLIGCGNLTGFVLGKCLLSMNSMTKLFVQGVKHIDDQFLKVIHDLSKQIEDLNLSGSSISDDGLIGFLRSAFKLRKLRLDNCCEITDKLVSFLPVVCPYIQDLSMRNCDHVEHPIILNYYDSMFLYQWYQENKDIHK